MAKRPRSIKKPSQTGALTLEDARAAVVVTKGGKKRKANATFMKAMIPSNALAAVIGSGAVPRTEVTRLVWGYIKRNGLLDKTKSGRVIHADEKLRPLFGGKSDVSLFEMTRLVSKHLK